MKTRIIRHGAGEYEVSRVGSTVKRRLRTVRITKVCDNGVYWIAAANWDSYLYTEPLKTKRDAVYYAKIMLRDEFA